MSVKNKSSDTQKNITTSEILKKTIQHPDIKLVKKIASISERVERSRAPLVPHQTKFYKL